MADKQSHNFHVDASYINIGDFTRKMLKNGSVPPEDRALVCKLYDANMRGLYGEGNLTDFNDIYINGRPVSDICAKAVQGKSDEEKSAFMKCYVAAAALERRHRIDCVVPSEDGHTKDAVPLHTRVNEPEPKKTLGRRILEFFRIKQPALSKQKQYERDIVSKPGFMKQSFDAYNALANDRYQLGKALFQDDYADEGKTGRGPVTFKTPGYLRLGRNGMNSGIAYLYGKGHSFEDILNPNKLLEEKREAGQTIRRWAEQALKNPSDPAPLENVTKMYQDFAKRYIEMPKLNIDHASPGDICANYREMNGRGMVAFDIGQELNKGECLKKAKENLGKEEFERILDPIATGSNNYIVLENSCLQPAEYLLTGSDTALHQGPAAIHLRGEFGEMMNKTQKPGYFASKFEDWIKPQMKFNVLIGDTCNALDNDFTKEQAAAARAAFIQGENAYKSAPKKGLPGYEIEFDRPKLPQLKEPEPPPPSKKVTFEDKKIEPVRASEAGQPAKQRSVVRSQR